MTEYIDRQAAISIPLLPKEHRYYQTLNLDDAFDIGWDAAMECVGLIPTADVRENVKGKWIERKDRTVECSACGEIAPYEADAWGDVIVALKYDFCPWCGADMRDEKDGSH